MCLYWHTPMCHAYPFSLCWHPYLYCSALVYSFGSGDVLREDHGGAEVKPLSCEDVGSVSCSESLDSSHRGHGGWAGVLA